MEYIRCLNNATLTTNEMPQNGGISLLHHMTKGVAISLFSLLSFATVLFSQEFEAGGIRYHITDSAQLTVEVIPNTSHYGGSIDIPASASYHSKSYAVTGIRERAFEDCTNLTSVAIPKSVKTIGVAAFAGCSRLTSVTIPNGVILIDEGAFYCCSGLTSIVIPNSVTTIGDVAFWGCSELNSVTISAGVKTIERYTFSGCSKLVSVTIPNGVTTIGEGAFYGCSSLTSVIISANVTDIGSCAFAHCSNLMAITSLNPTPPTLGECVFCCANYNSATIYMPEGSIRTYMDADQWHDFNHFIVIE